MALWKDTPVKPAPTNPTSPSFLHTDVVSAPSRADIAAPTAPEPAPIATPAAKAPSREAARAESLIAPDIAIEGKIEGSGHVRIAGRFKGDVNVRGDLTIEAGAKVNGSVRAEKVVVAGELVGNIESATRVELLSGGAVTGDVKAGSLTVAAGARMRGNADFGWEDSGKGNGAAS